MNDFTKEELQQILYDIACVRIYTDIGNFDETLFNKIQAMIHNYCEHPDVYIDYDYQPTRCKKCLEIIE